MTLYILITQYWYDILMGFNGAFAQFFGNDFLLAQIPYINVQIGQFMAQGLSLATYAFLLVFVWKLIKLLIAIFIGSFSVRG